MKIYVHLFLIFALIFIVSYYPCQGGQKREEQFNTITDTSEIENSIQLLLSETDKYIENYHTNRDVNNIDKAYNVTNKAYDKICNEATKTSNLKTNTYEQYRNFQTDKATYIASQIREKKIILLGSTLLPQICEKFYKIGELYIDTGDKIKARKVFRYIIIKFTTYEFKSCAKQAEFALEDLKESK